MSGIIGDFDGNGRPMDDAPFTSNSSMAEKQPTPERERLQQIKSGYTQKHLRHFISRFERDNAKDMTPEQWSEWVDALPIPEFMAMCCITPVLTTDELAREAMVPAEAWALTCELEGQSRVDIAKALDAFAQRARAEEREKVAKLLDQLRPRGLPEDVQRLAETVRAL